MRRISNVFVDRTTYLLADSGGPYKIEKMNDWASRCFNHIMAEIHGYEYIERPIPGGPPIEEIPKELIEVRDEMIPS